MLLQHAWLAPLVKPATITEEDEEEREVDAETAATPVAHDNPDQADLAVSQASLEPNEAVIDNEVADWVKDAIQKRKRGIMGKGAQKPALHAAPLDAVSSPSANGVSNLELPVAADPTAGGT